MARSTHSTTTVVSLPERRLRLVDAIKNYQDAGIRPIRTELYRGKKIVKRIHSSNPLRAASQCTTHLRINKYEATHAVIHDLVTGELYGVIRRDMNGNIRTIFEYALTQEEADLLKYRKKG